MANNPQKSQDATQLALEAIDAALKVHVEDRRAPPEAPPHRRQRPSCSTTSSNKPTWASEESHLRPANDDRVDIGQVLQSLRRRPSSTPYIFAGIASAVWVAGGIATAFLYRGELQTLLTTPRTGVAAVVALAAAIVLPVIVFYVLAHLVRRSQDLRLVAESMAEVAMRLAQPESAGNDAVVTVGQAVRREVAAMGDGVERALARAAELESLVHNEVSALERAYNDNEVRIRDLLSELSNQRDTLVGQAEHVRNAISAVHLDLSHDITSVGDLVADKVNEVAQRVTRSLTEKGEHITLALGHAGDSMIDALGDRGSTLLERLETTSDRTTTAISSASERLTDSLNFKTDHPRRIRRTRRAPATDDEHAPRPGGAELRQARGADHRQHGDALAAFHRGAQRHQRDHGRYPARPLQRGEFTLRGTTEEMNATLRAASDAMVRGLSLRGGDVVTKCKQTGARITETLRAPRHHGCRNASARAPRA